MLRSPPKEHSASDSNLDKIKGSDKALNITSRRKQKSSYGNDELNNFKEEIRILLQDWKEEQRRTFKELKEDISDVKQQNVDIASSIENLNKNHYELKQKVNVLEKEREDNLKRIENLENKLDSIQQQLRYNSIEIRNIPKTDNEDLEKIFSSICETTKTAIQPSMIEDIHRIPGKKENNKPIIVKLSNKRFKTEFMKGIKKYNTENKSDRLNTTHVGVTGSKSLIYISDHYTDKTKHLFFLSRDFAKSQEYKHCWVNNGRVFLRKTDGQAHILVKNVGHLQELKTLV